MKYRLIYVMYCTAPWLHYLPLLIPHNNSDLRKNLELCHKFWSCISCVLFVMKISLSPGRLALVCKHSVHYEEFNPIPKLKFPAIISWMIFLLLLGCQIIFFENSCVTWSFSPDLKRNSWRSRVSTFILYRFQFTNLVLLLPLHIRI
jgi:hypothetical protein